MTTPEEAPALIQYACERCKTRFVLPPSSRQLRITGKFHAFSMAIGRAFKQHEGLATGYDTARRQLLAKMDDEAYQSFVQSFRFCHECRQFVCNECWSTSRRSCLTCVAKSMTGTVRPRPPFAPTGPEIPRPVVAAAVPRKGRLRRDMALVALAIAIVLLSVEAGVLVVNATSGGVADATPTPGNSSTASRTGGTVAVGSSPSATETPYPTDSPTPEPTFTPSLPPGVSPSPRPLPTITCNGSDSSVSVTTAQSVSCSWTNSWFGTSTKTWYRDSVSNGSSAYWSSLPAGNHTIHLYVGQNNSYLDSNYINVSVSVAWTPPPPTPTPPPGHLYITATSGSMVYGGTPPAITPQYSGLTGGDTAPATPPTCSTVATGSSNVGSYPSSCWGASDPKYVISYYTGSISVTPASMTITASSASVTYGDAAPTITPSFSPNVDPGGVSCDTSYSQGLGAGSYGTICSGGSSSNYSYTYNGGTVSVGRIALHVTCASREINVIDPQPTLDPPSVSGSFYGSDGWTSGPTCTTAYVAGTDLAGPYAITPVATANPNYTVTPTDGLLTVDP